MVVVNIECHQIGDNYMYSIAKRNRPNQLLRKRFRENGVFLYEIAAEAGIAESTLHRWLRFPLESDQLAIIEQAEIAVRKMHDEEMLNG